MELTEKEKELAILMISQAKKGNKVQLEYLKNKDIFKILTIETKLLKNF